MLPQNVVHLDETGGRVSLWLRTKSATTAAAYRRDLGDFRARCVGSMENWRLDDALDWRDEMEAQGLAASTVKRKLGALRSFLRFEGIEWAGHVQTTRPPKDKLAERILTEAEVFSLFAAARSGRDRLMLRVMYGLGLRVSELVGLTWGELRGGVANVYGKGGKTRAIKLPSSLHEELEEFRGHDKARVFPLSRQRVGHIVKAAALGAGLSSTVSPHWLRHAHASHALDRGAGAQLVQRTLGHASLATTSRYTHARPDESSGDYLGVITRDRGRQLDGGFQSLGIQVDRRIRSVDGVDKIIRAQGN